MKGSQLSEHVRLSFSDDVPLLVEYKINEGSGYLRYYLAPKVDEKDELSLNQRCSSVSINQFPVPSINPSSVSRNPTTRENRKRKAQEERSIENGIPEMKMPKKSQADETPTLASTSLSPTITAVSPQSPQIQPPHSCKWHEMVTNNEYFDVTLIASDITKISSHRFLLSKYSTTFTNIFKESQELPVRIEMKEFTAETILAALDFMMDKFDSISGREFAVLKFAARYNIPDLMEVCSKTVEISLNNVCELIEIAYSHNLEDFKKKCLKFIVENKNYIIKAKFNGLPKNILIDVIRF